ncbi:MAG: urease accessory UreF family protein [Armatimonadota bacterium]
MTGLESAFPIFEWDWLSFMLQTSDALFPIGGYAHSFGFEETVRLGLVWDEVSLGRFLLEQICPAQRYHELPYLRFAYEAETMAVRCAIDAEISGWKLAREAREASLKMGSRRLIALQNIHAAQILREFSEVISGGLAQGHHLVVLGLQSRVAGVPLVASLVAYFYQAVASICAASLKLIRIGQDGVQRVLQVALKETQQVVGGSLLVERASAGWFNPLLEIAAMRHERAEERLFIS